VNASGLFRVLDCDGVARRRLRPELSYILVFDRCIFRFVGKRIYGAA